MAMPDVQTMSELALELGFESVQVYEYVQFEFSKVAVLVFKNIDQ